MLILIYLRNTMVLDYEQVVKYYFPSQAVITLVNIGEFVQGLESVVVFIFLLGGIVKISVCLYTATEGTARLLGQGSQSLAAPIGLMMLTFSLFVANDIGTMFEWADKYYVYYVLPIGLLFPVVLWVLAEIRNRKFEAP